MNSSTSAAEIPMSVSSALRPLPKSIDRPNATSNWFASLVVWKKKGRSSVVALTSSGIGLEEALAIVCQDQAPVIGGARPGPLHLERFVGGRRRFEPRGVEDRKPRIRRERLQPLHVAGRERGLLQEKRRHLVEADDGHVPGRIETTGRARLLRERHEPQAVEDPARNREIAALAEMVEILPEGFRRVQRVLGERVRAGGGGRPRVDERCLDDVVGLPSFGG